MRTTKRVIPNFFNSVVYFFSYTITQRFVVRSCLFIVLPYKIFFLLQVFSQPYLPLIRRYRLFIREGLLRFTRNDNVPYVIKDIASVIARVLSEAISRFHNEDLVTAVLRYGV